MKRLAPTIVARMTTRVVTDRTPGMVMDDELADRAGAVDVGRLVELVRDVLERGEVEEHVEAELLPGHHEGDHRHRQQVVDEP